MPTPCVSVEEGLQLARGLNANLRPFIAKYLNLVNGSRQYVKVDASKLHIYKAEADKLSQTEELLLSVMGTAYFYGIRLMTNEIECEDVEDLIYDLVIMLQLTEGFKSTESMLTVLPKDSGLAQFAPVITVEGEEE